MDYMWARRKRLLAIIPRSTIERMLYDSYSTTPELAQPTRFSLADLHNYILNNWSNWQTEVGDALREIIDAHC